MARQATSVEDAAQKTVPLVDALGYKTLNRALG